MSDTFSGTKPRVDPLPPTPLFHTQEQLSTAFLNQALPVSSLLFKCISATPTEPPVDPPVALPHADHDGTSSCPRCMLFYNTFVAIDGKKLEEATREQSSSQVWHDSRTLRITASTSKKVPIRTSPDAYLKTHVHPRFHGNAATRHGTMGEAKALQWLEEQGYSISRRGTMLCPGEPWLSASPDGIIDSGFLLEIKCPFLKAGETVKDLMESRKYDVKMVEVSPAARKWSSWFFHPGSIYHDVHWAKGMQAPHLVLFPTSGG